MTDFKLTNEQRDEILETIEGKDLGDAFTFGRKRLLRLLHDAINKYSTEDDYIPPKEVKRIFDVIFYELGELIASGCMVKIKDFGTFEPVIKDVEGSDTAINAGVDFVMSKFMGKNMASRRWFIKHMCESYARHEKLFAYADTDDAEE